MTKIQVLRIKCKFPGSLYFQLQYPHFSPKVLLTALHFVCNDLLIDGNMQIFVRIPPVDSGRRCAKTYQHIKGRTNVNIMNKLYEFNTVICKVPDLDGAYIEIPFDVKKEFGKDRVAVHVTFDGEPYDGQAVKMKTPGHIVGIRKDIRKKIGKGPGDVIHVTLQAR